MEKDRNSMEEISFIWEDYVKIERITRKWILKLILWAILIGYLPGILWYIAGYPTDILTVKCLIVTAGLPAVIGLSIWEYKKEGLCAPLSGSAKLNETEITVTKAVISESLYQYIRVWKTKQSMIEKITLYKDRLTVQSVWHTEAYERKRNGSYGSLVNTNLQKQIVKIKIPTDRIMELDLFLNRQYPNKYEKQEDDRI